MQRTVMKWNLVLISAFVLAACSTDDDPVTSTSGSIEGSWSKCLTRTHNNAAARKLKTKTFNSDGTYVRTDWYFVGTSCDAANQDQIYKKKLYTGTYKVQGDAPVLMKDGSSVVPKTIDLDMTAFARTYYGAEAAETHCNRTWRDGKEQNMLNQACGSYIYEARVVYEIFFVAASQMSFGHADHDGIHHHDATTPNNRPIKFGSDYTTAVTTDFPTL